MTETSNGWLRLTHEINSGHLGQHPSRAGDLAKIMLAAANTQEPGTPLYGYPGGTPSSEATQLGIMADECEQAGIPPETIAEASQLVLNAWAQRRNSR